MSALFLSAGTSNEGSIGRTDVNGVKLSANWKCGDIRSILLSPTYASVAETIREAASATETAGGAIAEAGDDPESVTSATGVGLSIFQVTFVSNKASGEISVLSCTDVSKRDTFGEGVIAVDDDICAFEIDVEVDGDFAANDDDTDTACRQVKKPAVADHI